MSLGLLLEGAASITLAAVSLALLSASEYSGSRAAQTVVLPEAAAGVDDAVISRGVFCRPN